MPVGSAVADASEALAYENEAVVRRLAEEHAVPIETAARWFRELLKFLHASAAAAQRGDGRFSTVPSLAVDEAWHAFILHTRDYAAYCDTHFGGFVHHAPRPSETDGDLLAEHDYLLRYLKTRALVAELYGPLDEEIWLLPQLEGTR